MQFENKLHSDKTTPDKVRGTFTLDEAHWLESAGDVSAHNRPLYLGFLRKLNQARREVVGDKLPETVAVMPLVRQDMPFGANYHGMASWLTAMKELRQVEVEHQAENLGDTPCITVELDPDEIDMLEDKAALALTLAGPADSAPKPSMVEGIAPEWQLDDRAGFYGVVENRMAAEGVAQAITAYRGN